MEHNGEPGNRMHYLNGKSGGKGFSAIKQSSLENYWPDSPSKEHFVFVGPALDHAGPASSSPELNLEGICGTDFPVER